MIDISRIDTSRIDTTWIDTTVVATMTHYCASGSDAARPIYATGALQSPCLGGAAGEEAPEQGSCENEALHYSLPRMQ
jgi:hypothetical protein